jgi:hypothetical protein
MERTERRPDRPETPPEAESTDTRRDWEPIQENGPSDRTERMRIKGGWLYRTVVYADDTSRMPAVAMVFVSGD